MSTSATSVKNYNQAVIVALEVANIFECKY